eukprot:2592109-Prymnesium_polylepis.1
MGQWIPVHVPVGQRHKGDGGWQWRGSRRSCALLRFSVSVVRCDMCIRSCADTTCDINLVREPTWSGERTARAATQRPATPCPAPGLVNA